RGTGRPAPALGAGDRDRRRRGPGGRGGGAGPGGDRGGARRRGMPRGGRQAGRAMTAAGLKILLVEDNELNRDMLCRRLQRRGYAVVVAVDGVEGVEAAGRERPDVVLMDL